VRNVVVGVLLVACAGLGGVTAWLGQRVAAQQSTIAALHTALAEAEKAKVDAVHQEGFLTVVEIIERTVASGYTSEAGRFWRLEVPVQVDEEARTLFAEIEVDDTSYIEVQLVFAYQRGKWVPQWEESYVTETPLYSWSADSAEKQMLSDKKMRLADDVRRFFSEVLRDYLTSPRWADSPG